MKKRFYILQNNQQVGPVSLSNLLSREFSSAIQIWSPGMSDWQTIENPKDFKKKYGHLAPNLQKPQTESDISLSRELNDAEHYDPLKVNKSITREQTHADLLHYDLAGAGIRFLAFMINFFIHFGIAAAFMGMLESLGDNSVMVAFLISTASALVTYTYKSGNVGHIILGLKVIHAKTGEDFNRPVTGYLREVVKLFFASFFIPAMWLLFDAEKQNLYDKMFGTLVVKNRKKDDIF